MSKLISVSHSGSFDNTKNFLKKMKERKIVYELFNQYGPMITSALQSSTPVRTGKTASSWYYTISSEGSSVSLEFHNNNMANDGKTPVAILIQYGHGTGTGGYIPARDYINPVVLPLFDQLEDAIGKAVNSL